MNSQSWQKDQCTAQANGLAGRQGQRHLEGLLQDLQGDLHGNLLGQVLVLWRPAMAAPQRSPQPRPHFNGSTSHLSGDESGKSGWVESGVQSRQICNPFRQACPGSAWVQPFRLKA